MQFITFIDWIPFATSAIQTNVIKWGKIAGSPSEKLFGSYPIAGAVWVLRLDGVLMITAQFRDEFKSIDAQTSIGNALSDHVRRTVLRQKFSALRTDKKGRIIHKVVVCEDAWEPAYGKRLQSMGLTSPLAATRPDTLDGWLEQLKVLAGDNKCLAMLDRKTIASVAALGSAGEHYALLYLKSLMGTRRDWLYSTGLTEIRKREETNSHYLPASFLMFLLKLVAILLIFTVWVSLRHDVLSVGNQSSSPPTVWSKLAAALSDLDTVKKLVSYMFLAGAITIFLSLFLYYRSSYRRRVKLFSNAISYFSICNPYSIGIASIYKEVNDSQGNNPIFHVHNRGFEGVIEDLKIRLQNEHMRLRDFGLLASLAAAILAVIGRFIAT